MQLSYEQATMVGTFLARRVEEQLAWNEMWDCDDTAVDTYANGWSRAIAESKASFDELTDDERLFVDRFGETLETIRRGLQTMVREGESLLGRVA